MRILDEESNKSLERIIVYFTIEEAVELQHDLENLIKHPGQNHVHISSNDFQKEITVCIYNPDNLNGFNKRTTDLINNDI